VAFRSGARGRTYAGGRLGEEVFGPSPPARAGAGGCPAWVGRIPVASRPLRAPHLRRDAVPGARGPTSADIGVTFRPSPRRPCAESTRVETRIFRAYRGKSSPRSTPADRAARERDGGRRAAPACGSAGRICQTLVVFPAHLRPGRARAASPAPVRPPFAAPSADAAGRRSRRAGRHRHKQRPHGPAPPNANSS